LYDVAGSGLSSFDVVNYIAFIVFQNNQMGLAANGHLASFYSEAILTFFKVA
jgi:hypothetical protein